jgi:lysophospholipase L1-like esterase
MEPDVVTIVCGANDVLESVRPDADAYAKRLSRMFARLRREAPRAAVVTATYPDISRFLDLRPRSRARVEKGMRRFNAACRAVARRHGVALLDGTDHPAAAQRGTYAADGFHPSEEGHRHAAMEFLRALRGRLRPAPA